MKNKLLAVTLVPVLFASCSSNDQGNTSASSDSVTVVENTKPVPTPTNQNGVALAAFDVKGPVCHIFTNNDWEEGMVTKFDEKGNILYCFNAVRAYDVELKANALVLTDTPDGALLYRVENGCLVEKSKTEANIFIGKKYIYSGNQLKQIDVKEEDDAEGTSSAKTYSVKVLSTDSYGNWTSRMVGNKKEERKIDYYGSAQNIQDLPFDLATYTFSGSIGGDKYATLTLGPSKSYCHLNNGNRIISNKAYEPKTGVLTLKATLNGKYIGNYVGKLSTNKVPFTYEGQFENVNGGKVDFKLSLEGPIRVN